MIDSTISFYDQLAADYHLLFADWARAVAWQSEVIDRLIRAELGAEAATVLDCACGIGTQAIGLAQRGYRVYAIDVSPAAVERARREAARCRVDLAFGVADMRALDVQMGGRFDAVIAFDNALPHLLSPEDVRRAVRAMASRLREGGLLLTSIRDYDRILAERPSGEMPRVIDDATGRRIVFQVWEWADDGLAYDLHLFILRRVGTGWETRERMTRYRALRRDELTAALDAAGLTDIRWLMPDESGYYQPVVLARLP